ncbi:MAG TPA: isoprenylcysteine carboxylmethyltransferase family protein [Rhizomicrobium sp.]|jgi:methyltransferase|nr:isoprenylcysteine carboxylmethyltransferase family protein [Rhizomicrobium sp.]
MTGIAYAIIFLVVLQRLGELVLANRNTRRLKAQGAVEIGARHYPLIVLLHTAWLLAVLWLLPAPLEISWPWLAIFVLLQAARIWVISSLGPYWTTRIISVPGAPLVRRGPYRFVRHPNYLVVAGEILALPLAFHEIPVAIFFSLANAAILFWRIREEEAGLVTRRELS